MGQKKNADMSMTNTEIKVVENVMANPATQADSGMDITIGTADTEPQIEGKAKKKTAQKKLHSQKYQAVRSQVDKTRLYDTVSAIELVKKLSYSRFPGTVVAHLILDEKFQGERINLQLPHSTGKSITVAIADEKILAEVAKGEINFDVLLATPDMMPKLARLAKILGPRGLMPNPKQGTLIADTASKKKELESGKVVIRSENKAPLMHIIIGNVSMDATELVSNLQALLKTLKGKVQKVSIAATMSPGIKVAL